MRILPRSFLFVTACLLAACSAPGAPATTSALLRIDGDVPERALSMEDLQALGPVDVTWTHKGRTRTYSAVALEALLRSVGVDGGSMSAGTAASEKRAGWKYAVVATASDGFQATFSVAEVFRGMGKTEAYVAFREDGMPIDEAAGPLRLVVPTDGEASRSARNLVRLTILDLRRFVPGDRSRR